MVPEHTDKIRTHIAAHRAGAALWPENSLSAFRNAFMTKVDFIEFDVHRTRDGVLVVHHDPELGRMVDGTSALADMDWPELRVAKLHDAPDEHIPLLAEVLPMFDGSEIRPRLELKVKADGDIYHGLTSEVIMMLRATGLLQQTVVSSFDIRYLSEASAAAVPHLLWLLRDDFARELFLDTPGFAAKARAYGIEEVAIRGSDATPERVAQCCANGLILGAYAGKSMDFDRLLTIGLSAFTSDRPDIALAVREKLQRH